MKRLTYVKQKSRWNYGKNPTQYSSRETFQSVCDRLGKIEDILGDEYDLDHLRELKKADDEGRCVVLPFKPPRWVYVCSTRFPKPAQAHYASAINVLQDMDKGCVFGDTQEEAAAALRREQDG